MGAIVMFVTLLLVQVSVEHSLNSRISNGRNAFPGQFLFMASIQLIKPPRTYYIHICAGTVIDNKWILSTAVCAILVEGSSTAMVKTHIYFTQDNDPPVQVFSIEKTIPHEHFNKSNPAFCNDIGLIKLSTRIYFSIMVKLNEPRNSITGDLRMIGWGRTSAAASGNTPKVLQYASVRILENEECQNMVRVSRPLQDSHICTYSSGKAITACKGDSGGPIIGYGNNGPEIVGIISWTLNPCGQVGSPTISTRVSRFIGWINEKIGKVPNKMSDTDNLWTPLLVPN